MKPKEFNFEEILSQKMNKKGELIPGKGQEFPLKAFVDFHSLERHLWVKDKKISMSNFIHPAIGIL